MRAIWSIHDVSPATVNAAVAIAERLTAAGIGPFCVLVVPAGDWPEGALAQLRAWSAEGHLLAPHGWTHRAPKPRGLYHRLHSLLLSREAAEHLGRSKAGVREIVENGRAWFEANDLPAPIFYIPPAWAMGVLPLREMAGYGFERVETLTGIWDARKRRTRLLPLIGFEADTRFRAASLHVLNAINITLARLSGRPLRIGIHPDDGHLLLADDLDRWIRRAPGALLP
ncbi:MAG: polysaccharide deacetylase family protein [Anaerolineaceae bacterium]